jgi:hypothetical protein
MTNLKKLKIIFEVENLVFTTLSLWEYLIQIFYRYIPNQILQVNFSTVTCNRFNVKIASIFYNSPMAIMLFIFPHLSRILSHLNRMLYQMSYVKKFNFSLTDSHQGIFIII